MCILTVQYIVTAVSSALINTCAAALQSRMYLQYVSVWVVIWISVHVSGFSTFPDILNNAVLYSMSG